jgi:hypothetical protein
MLVELCARNYHTSNSFVNDTNETFKEYTKIVLKPLIWINFHNLHIGFNIRLEISHIYKKFPTLNKNWTPIEQKVTEIQIVNNLFHIITRIQFPFQLAT